jgi:hypothetical protein
MAMVMRNIMVVHPDGTITNHMHLRSKLTKILTTRRKTMAVEYELDQYIKSCEAKSIDALCQDVDRKTKELENLKIKLGEEMAKEKVVKNILKRKLKEELDRFKDPCSPHFEPDPDGLDEKNHVNPKAEAWAEEVENTNETS